MRAASPVRVVSSSVMPCSFPCTAAVVVVALVDLACLATSDANEKRLPSLQLRDDRRMPGVVPPCFRRGASLAWPVSEGQPSGLRVVSQRAWCRNLQPWFQLAEPTQ